MNLESLGLFVIGVITVSIASLFFAKSQVRAWIEDECIEQGPDYVKSNLIGRLLAVCIWPTVMLAAFIVLDALLFRKRDMLVPAIRKVPGLSEYGEEGTIVWALWLGILVGIVAGTLIGFLWAVLKFPKSRCIIQFIGK